MAPKTTTKTTTTKIESTAAPAVVSTPVVAAAATTEAVAPKKRTAAKKDASPVVESAAPVVESAAPVESVATTTEVSAPSEIVEQTLTGTELIIKKMQEQLAETATFIHSAQTNFKTLQTAIKSLEKEYSKERKEMEKKVAKTTRKSSKARSPSGFAKQSPISAQLAEFLGLPEGTELARTEATRKINAYIKEHNLQNPAAKKQIICDAKLKGLLQPADGEVVEYFNLQRFLKKHFTTKADLAAASLTA